MHPNIQNILLVWGFVPYKADTQIKVFILQEERALPACTFYSEGILEQRGMFLSHPAWIIPAWEHRAGAWS